MLSPTAFGLLITALVAALSLGSCGDGDEPAEEGSAGERQLDKLGLAVGPPPNLAEGCEYVASQTSLEWQCPPVVPAGPVEIHPGVLKRQPRLAPFMSLESESLPTVRDPVHQGHWVIYAGMPAREVRAALYSPRGSPDVGAPAESQVPDFTVDGVRAEVVKGEGPELGINKDHALVYWQMEGAGYVVSVHGYVNAPIAKEIARGLIRQMVN
jgi:hypothetical protein